ncbi:MAG: hypothetical protein WD011_04205 [Nitriliruptoraceae bacterium]
MDAAERLGRVFKAYDIRGLVGEELDEASVRAIGTATAELVASASGRIVVGRDMRPSSPVLVDAFIEGVTACGVDVVDIGLASTDLLYFASGVFDAPGAMFTASHNPAAYNGIKLCGPSAAPISQDTGLAAIRDRAGEVMATSPAATSARGTRESHDLLERYAAHVGSFVDVAALAGVRVAVDAGNGMAGYTWPAVAAEAGIETVPLYFDLDGTFPNHPADPLDPANLGDLQAAVSSADVAAGFAFDGDADRVFAVDETGACVSASATGALIAQRVLAREPGAIVLHNLICSRIVPETITTAGGRPRRTRVGHSYIKQVMAETGAALAIEHSGHYYFRDNYRADSGAIAALLLLEAVVAGQRPLSALVATVDRYVRSGERNFTVGNPTAVIDSVRAHFGATDIEDGVTVSWPDGWFNLRASNTEPVVRLNAEAGDDVRLRSIVDEVVALLEGT